MCKDFPMLMLVSQPHSNRRNSNQSFSSRSVLRNWGSLCINIVVEKLQSSGLRLKHGSIASIKTTRATIILWIVLSWICNLYMAPSWKALLHTVFFCSTWVFFHEHSRLTRQHGKVEAISSPSLYHFHSVHRHLDISRTIAAESSPLHIASSQTRIWNLWFSSASY